MRIKRRVVERQGYLCRRCGVRAVHYEGQNELQRIIKTNFDHEPALRLRNINRAGTDYIPPQHSAKHIDALCQLCHRAKTHGSGATVAGTDFGKMKKERKRAKAISIMVGEVPLELFGRRIPKLKFKWPKRQMRSRSSWSKKLCRE